MKVLMLCPYFYPEPNAAAARATAFAKYLTREGADVRIIVPQGSEAASQKEHLGVPIESVNSYDSMRTRRGFIRSVLGLRRGVRELRTKIDSLDPDIVMTTTPSPFFAYQGHLACRPLGIPIVFDVRDAWVQLMSFRQGRLGNYMKRKIEGRCCWGAAKVLTVTEMLVDLLVEEHGLARDRIAVVPNGSDLELFNVERVPNIDVILLGAPSIYRNLEQVFLALSLVIKSRPATSIRYVGWVDNEYALGLKSLARKLGILDHMELLPPVPQSQVPHVLARARIGVVSLGNEANYGPSIGAKAYEYLAAGLPLACFCPLADGELRRLAESTQAGFYTSTPQEFAEKLEHFLRDDTLQAFMSEKAKNASVRYSREHIVRRLYRDVLLPIAEERRKPGE